MTITHTLPITHYRLLRAQPWRELEQLMDAAFAKWPSYSQPATSGGSHLLLDVHENATHLTLSAELPGLTAQDMEITFEDGVLTIKGEKKLQREEQPGSWHLSERRSGRFMRQLALPTEVDADAISARLSNGVLTITMPKQSKQAEKAKTISIQTAN